MNRVEISRPIVGLCFMQVCVVPDATDEEILEVCNRDNPSGTSHGWVSVCRDGEFLGEQHTVVNCEDFDGRLHILVGC